VLIDRPQEPPSGAAEMAVGPLPAAIGNAVFDATGVRLRRVPFTPERVKAALSRA
jgi:nicotinate dehydrogenase subunit B